MDQNLTNENNPAKRKIDKIKVGAVSYLNTKPLVYGWELGMMNDIVKLVDNYPSKISAALLKDEIDIALLPVAVIPQMKEYYIIGEHCIACDGEVDSVCLFSEVPLEKITKILLDYQSRTSVELLKILCKEFWKIAPVFKQVTEGYENTIKDTTAALIIGDRALQKKLSASYIYDLGGAWKQYTGLPFVFAAWVSNKPLSGAFIKEFELANDYGLTHICEVINANPSPYDLEKYYTQSIHYLFNSDKRKGLEAFLGKIAPLFNLKIDA